MAKTKYRYQFQVVDDHDGISVDVTNTGHVLVSTIDGNGVHPFCADVATAKALHLALTQAIASAEAALS